MTNSEHTSNRARTKAIRTRMDQTGENWTTASRNHDAAQNPGPAADAPPSRVVDHNNQGWYRVATLEPTPEPQYEASYGLKRGLTQLAWPELVRTRGPLRPVEPITDADSAQLHELFAAAGRRTVTTLASALHQTFAHFVRNRPNPHSGSIHEQVQNGEQAFDFARQSLLAGREGSWESEVLMNIMWFGRELNEAQGERPGPAPDHAEPAPSKRVNTAVRNQLTEILLRWVTAPDRYTEVAATLAFQVASYCDNSAGADGWRAVADQWLQPGGLASEDFRNCYNLLYSTSRHFDPELL
jgi:hypothetical protein